MARSRRRVYGFPFPGERPVYVSQEVRSLKPPVPEQLGVEGSNYDAFTILRLPVRDSLQQLAEMVRVTARAIACRIRLIQLLVSEIHTRPGDPPQLEPA